MNTHGLTGAFLEQPKPPLRRQFAMFDRGQPCLDHSCCFTGKIPCTGAYRCDLCGAEWDDRGRLVRPRTVIPVNRIDELARRPT